MPHRSIARLFRARPNLSLVLILVVMMSSSGVAWWHGAGMERLNLTLAAPGEERAVSEFDVDDLMAPDLVLAATDAEVRTFLLVGVGAAGMDVDAARELGITDAASRGEDLATDTMMMLITHQRTGQAALLSLPRDTWLEHRSGRLNAVYAHDGDQALIGEVERLTGIPVHHFVRVNFGGFAGIVEAAGGVEMAIDRPLRDDNAKLLIEEPGCYVMGPSTALAYVRSRNTLTLNDAGRWVADEETTDFGRQAKQRRFLAAAWDGLQGPQLVRALPGLMRTAGDNVALDSGLGLSDLVTLARAFQGVGSDAVEQHQLPGHIGRAGRLSVIHVDEAAARPLLDRLANWPPVSEVEEVSVRTPASDAAEPGGTASDEAEDAEPEGGVAAAPELVAPVDVCAPGRPRHLVP